jgi:hypothetical protein
MNALHLFLERRENCSLGVVYRGLKKINEENGLDHTNAEQLIVYTDMAGQDNCRTRLKVYSR